MKIGVADTPIAIMALLRLGPKNAASAIARIRNGQASMASVIREISASTQPPTYPASKPIGTPNASEIDTDTIPARSDARVPHMTRESTSRPISSVPNQCAALGALRIALQLVAKGSYGATSGASNASSTKKTTTPNAAIARRRRARRLSARQPGEIAGGVDAVMAVVTRSCPADVD